MFCFSFYILGSFDISKIYLVCIPPIAVLKWRPIGRIHWDHNGARWVPFRKMRVHSGLIWARCARDAVLQEASPSSTWANCKIPWRTNYSHLKQMPRNYIHAAWDTASMYPLPIESNTDELFLKWCPCSLQHLLCSPPSPCRLVKCDGDLWCQMVAPSYSCIRPERVGHLIGTARHVTQTSIYLGSSVMIWKPFYMRGTGKRYIFYLLKQQKTQSRNIMQSYSRVLPSEMEEGHSCAHKWDTWHHPHMDHVESSLSYSPPPVSHASNGETWTHVVLKALSYD